MATTGSLINHLMVNSKQATPELGMGATAVFWTDREPYTVVEVISPRKIVVQADNYKRVDNHGMSDSQDYEYSPDPNGRKATLSLRKNGDWREVGKGNLFSVGHRSCYHDYSY